MPLIGSAMLAEGVLRSPIILLWSVMFVLAVDQDTCMPLIPPEVAIALLPDERLYILLRYAVTVNPPVMAIPLTVPVVIALAESPDIVF